MFGALLAEWALPFLATLFALSALAKFQETERFWAVLLQYPLGAYFRRPEWSLTIPAVEAAVAAGLLLLPAPVSAGAAGLAVVFLCAVTYAVWMRYQHGEDRFACGCGGTLEHHSSALYLLGRNAILIVAASGLTYWLLQRPPGWRAAWPMIAAGFVGGVLCSHWESSGAPETKTTAGVPADTSVGSQWQELHARTIAGHRWRWRFPAERGVLAVFVSPECPACGALIPDVRSFATRHDEQAVLFSLSPDREANRRFLRETHPEGLALLDGHELADQLHVAGAPHAVLFTSQGVLAASRNIHDAQDLETLALATTSSGD
jgi:hypothetical protein